MCSLWAHWTLCSVYPLGPSPREVPPSGMLPVCGKINGEHGKQENHALAFKSSACNLLGQNKLQSQLDFKGMSKCDCTMCL